MERVCVYERKKKREREREKERERERERSKVLEELKLRHCTNHGKISHHPSVSFCLRAEC